MDSPHPPQLLDDSVPPLHGAAFFGNLGRLRRLVQQVEREHKGEKIGRVLEKLFDGCGYTALHLAACNGKIKICKYLIKELQVNVDVPSRNNNSSPLYLAIMGTRHSTAVYLLDNGANVNAACNYGATPLHLAAKNGFDENLVKLLISRGAEIEAVCQSGTPLQMAASVGKKDSVKILLDNHADPNANHSRDYSPLVAAVNAKSIDCVKMLLQAGADPNLRSVREMPLEAAATVKDTEIIKCLLAAGANPDTRDELDLTPLEIAAIGGQHEDVLVLFPVTARIAGMTDWSVAGVMEHVQTEEARRKREDKKRKVFLEFKSEGKAAFERKNYVEAVHYYSECHRLEPHDPCTLGERAACWAMLNENNRAESDMIGCIVTSLDSESESGLSVEVAELDAATKAFRNIVYYNAP